MQRTSLSHSLHLVFALPILLGALVCPPAGAIERINPVDQSRQQEQQQKRLDQAREQREALQAQQPQPAPAVTPTPNAQAAVLQGQACIRSSGVSFVNVTLPPTALRQQISTTAAQACLDAAALGQLLDQINNWYVAHGYVTSHAWLQPPTQPGGALVLAAVEGRVQAVTVKDGKPAAQRAAKMAFLGSPGEVLDLRQLEQSVEQLERVTQGPVTVAVQAADTPGYSNVVLSAEMQPWMRASATLDNSGMSSTGTNQLTAALNVNNVLGLAEQFSVSANTNPRTDNSRYRNNYSAAVSLPAGPWTFSYAGSAGDYAIPFSYADVPMRYSGDSVQHQVQASRMLQRNARYKLDAFAAMAYYDGTAALEEFELTNAAERTTSAQRGLNFASSLPGSRYLTLSPVITHGLAGGSRDMSAGGGPDAGFTRLALGASLYSQLSPSVAWFTSAYAQTSRQLLYSSEQISVGGESSVRGFKEQYLSGDTGAYLRNELNWSLPVPAFNSQLNLQAALDIGRVVPGLPGSGGNLVGAAVGASLPYKNLAASILVGVPLHAPAALDADPVVFYLRMSFLY